MLKIQCVLYKCANLLSSLEISCGDYSSTVKSEGLNSIEKA